jgi:RAD51-like protein 1
MASITHTSVAAPLRADRKLSRVRGLTSEQKIALDQSPFRTCRDVLSCRELDLVDALNLYLPDVRAIVRAVSRTVVGAPRAARALLGASVPEGGDAAAAASSSSCHMSTGLPDLDAHLGGGLPSRQVCELVGPAGVGKTQLCLSVAAHALVGGAERGAHVLYVDTEGSFSASRMHQLLLLAMCAKEAPNASAVEAERLLARLTVLQPRSWSEYVACLSSQLEQELLKQPAVSLVVVDSIAMAVNRHFDHNLALGSDDKGVVQRQAVVGAQAARLKRHADVHGVCVLCVNQVVGGGSGAFGHAGDVAGDIGSIQGQEDLQLLAYLGTAWAHCVNVRLVMQYPRFATQLPPPPPPGVVATLAPERPMHLRVAKAPMCAEATFDYVVSTAGVVTGVAAADSSEASMF